MMKRAGIYKFGLLLLVLLPFCLLVFLSLTKSWFFPEILPKHFTTESWQGIISGGDFIVLLFKSVLLSCCVACVSSFLAFMISRNLSRYHFREIFYSLAYLPYSFSPVIYAFCIQFLFIRSGLKGSYAGVFAAQILITFPFAILLFARHWTREMQNQEMLSQSLGATSMQSFTKVVLPLSGKIIRLSLLQTFLISWFDYGISWVIGGGVTGTLMLKIYQYIAEANIAYAAAASLILLIPPVFVIIFQHKYSANVA